MKLAAQNPARLKAPLWLCGSEHLSRKLPTKLSTDTVEYPQDKRDQFLNRFLLKTYIFHRLIVFY